MNDCYYIFRIVLGGEPIERVERGRLRNDPKFIKNFDKLFSVDRFG